MQLPSFRIVLLSNPKIQNHSQKILVKILTGIFSSVLFILLTTSLLFGQTQAERIDSLIKTAHEIGIFNGNILVAKNGKVIYQNEIGYAEAGRIRKLNKDLRFNIGSISKEFDAVSIMMLVEEGKLELNNAVSKFFSDLPAWSKKVTLKNLLQYTSGLPKVKFNRYKPFTDADAWRALKELEDLEFEPGTGYIYSNFNIFLLKRIIEKVSGQSYSTFLQDKIFEPNRMNGAIIDPAPNNNRLARAFNNKFIEDDYAEFMSGSIYLTVRDLYRWTRLLHDYKIIKQASLIKLFEGYEQKESTLGTGYIKNDKVLMHWNSGSSYNFESSHYINLKDDFTVILMTNNKNFNVGDLTNAIDAILRNEAFTVPRKSLYMALRTEIYYNGFESGKKLLTHIRSYKKELYDSDVEKAIHKTANYLNVTNKIEDAIELLHFATAEYPDSPKLMFLLGDSYFKQGNKERALAHYEKAGYLDPANEEIEARIKKIKAKK